jgi:hypothetical protein
MGSGVVVEKRCNHMAQELIDNGHMITAGEASELIAEFLALQKREPSSFQVLLTAASLDPKSDMEEDIFRPIAEALAALGEDILSEPIPHRLLEAVLKPVIPDAAI